MAELYVIDANVLIQAANVRFPFSARPDFWSFLSNLAQEGTLRTVPTVKEEVKYPSELREWFADRSDEGFIIDTSAPKIQESFTEFADQLVAEDKNSEETSRFLSGADMWVVASAATLNGTVVTEELTLGIGSQKVRIPSVCEQHGVLWLTTFQLLKLEGFESS